MASPIRCPRIPHLVMMREWSFPSNSVKRSRPAEIIVDNSWTRSSSPRAAMDACMRAILAAAAVRFDSSVRLGNCGHSPAARVLAWNLAHLGHGWTCPKVSSETTVLTAASDAPSLANHEISSHGGCKRRQQKELTPRLSNEDKNGLNQNGLS